MELCDNIRELIIRKSSNICVSIDYTNTNDILQIINWLKDKIVMVKLHVDIIKDFNQEFISRLEKICNDNNIFIFEDRKFADIGNTFKHQFTGGMFKIRDWCDITNCHPIVGNGIIKEFSKCKRLNQGMLLIAEMSNKGNLIDDSYTLKCKEMAENNRENILVFISQHKIADGFLHLCPGIRLSEKTDGKDQQYSTPEEAMSRGVDILIIGRGITGKASLNEIIDECEKYRLTGWENYITYNSF